METTVVITAVALLAVFALPAIRGLFNSLESRGSTKAMINATLSSARAMALKNQKYTGIRFQQDLAGHQYMIFIINDEEIPNGTQGNLGCRAIEGIEPLKLPDSIGVMDLITVGRTQSGPGHINVKEKDITKSGSDTHIDNEIDDPNELRDTTTFAILFSPSGKLVIHSLWVLNRDGYRSHHLDESFDSIFNKFDKVQEWKALFYQDDYFGSATTDLGLGPELSRRFFVIYDKNIFKQIDVDERWSEYLKDLPHIHLNPYTGTMINK